MTRKIGKTAAVALLLTTVLVYLAAKVHFFTRFNASHVDLYVSEHWPLWATMDLLAVLALLLLRVARDQRAAGGWGSRK